MIYRLSVLFTAVLLITGCETIDRTLGSSSGMTSTEEYAAGTASISGFSGFADVPIPAGAKMDLSNTLVFGTGESWSGRLVKNVNMNMAETYDFYLSNMPSFGWRQITVVRSDVSVMTYQRNNRISTITLRPRGLGGTQIQFNVSPRGGEVSPPPPPVTSSGNHS